jgi:phosphatidylserine decarboxylase
VVTLGDAKQSTPTISKTLNPEWNVSFDLPIVGLNTLLLEATCWDKDRFGKDYLGEFDVAVEEIFSNGQVVQEVICQDKPMHRKNANQRGSQSGTHSRRNEKGRRRKALMYQERSSYNSS